VLAHGGEFALLILSQVARQAAAAGGAVTAEASGAARGRSRQIRSPSRRTISPSSR